MRYITDDGKEFDSFAEATAHETSDAFTALKFMILREAPNFSEFEEGTDLYDVDACYVVRDETERKVLLRFLSEYNREDIAKVKSMIIPNIVLTDTEPLEAEYDEINNVLGIVSDVVDMLKSKTAVYSKMLSKVR